MNQDGKNLEKYLKQLMDNLSDKPKWVGLVDENGNLIASVGKIASKTNHIAEQIKRLARQNHRTLNKTSHGNFDVSVHIGTSGTLFIMNMFDSIYLAVS